jgi:outer membrane protein TolC
MDAAAAQCRSVPGVEGAILIGDGAALLSRRPDVRRAERALAADTARFGVATAELYPSITLLGSVGLGAPKVGDLGKDASLSYSLGPVVSWNLPNFAVARAHIAEAKGRASASLAAFDGAVLSALREVEQALARYGAAREQNAALARATAAADDAARLSQIRFDQGRDNFLDLLVAEQNRDQARAALAKSNQTVADSQVSLFKALGGGWETTSPAQGRAGAGPARAANRGAG